MSDLRTADQKLCRDCRYYTTAMHYAFPRCVHPDVPPADLATGEREWADWVRKFGRCGRDAKLFEKKPPHIPWHVRVLWKFNNWLERRS